VHVTHQMYLIYTACNQLRLSTDIKSLLTYLLTKMMISFKFYGNREAQTNRLTKYFHQLYIYVPLLVLT